MLHASVKAAVESFGAGFLVPKENRDLAAKLRSSPLFARDYYRQLIVLTFRLIFIRVAEERRPASGDILLHPPETPAKIRERYARSHSLGRLLKLADGITDNGRGNLYDALKELFQSFRDGYAPWGIPAFGWYLFSPHSCPDLDRAALNDERLLDSLRKLCLNRESTRQAHGEGGGLDFANLGAEIPGSVYESLLELEAEFDGDAGRLRLSTARSHERKATGSYYTPPALIERLLETTLDPLINAATEKADLRTAEQALLELKVCDPACGSGHFLMAAADRIAQRLVRLRCGERQSSAMDVQQARRDVITRCLYGVDLNPTAVALCRMSLWMQASTPGDPVQRLDEHIQVGNSLLGMAPRCADENVPADVGLDGIVAPRGLPDSLRPIHWRLAFPEVFSPQRGRVCDTTEEPWGGFDVVLGNPPWISYSGRQKIDIQPRELSLLRHRFPSIARWPASHSAFLLRSIEIVRRGGRIGLVLPRQMADLEAYAATRSATTAQASLVGPVIDAEEDAFPGVTQPVGLYSLERRHRHVAGSQQDWPLGRSGDVDNGRPRLCVVQSSTSDLLADLLPQLSQRPRFAPGTFGDPGVHTGNVVRKILASFAPPEADGWSPIREGRDMTAFHCGPPAKWLWTVPELIEGEYCTIRSADRYRLTPILLRQTANRPIAARHRSPAYYRNSLLACRGVAGVPDSVVIAFLNSALYALLHRESSRDANQKAFPQVKVRHLQALPAIPSDRLGHRCGTRTLGEEFEAAVRNAEERASRHTRLPAEALERVERLVLLAMDLPTDLAPALLAATS